MWCRVWERHYINETYYHYYYFNYLKIADPTFNIWFNSYTNIRPVTTPCQVVGNSLYIVRLIYFYFICSMKEWSRWWRFLPSCHFGEHMVCIIHIGRVGSKMATPILAKHKDPANNFTSSIPLCWSLEKLYCSGNNSEFHMATYNAQLIAKHTGMAFNQLQT